MPRRLIPGPFADTDAQRPALPPDDAQLNEAFTHWADWVATNLVAGYADEALVERLVREGFPSPYAQARVAAMADTPVLRPARHAAREVRKLASLLEVYGQLFARSGFELQKRWLASEEFYEQYVFVNQPVVLSGVMSECAALAKWTPEYFRSHYGDVEIEITRERDGDPRYEDNFLVHRSSTTMAEYVNMLLDSGPSNDYYLVARNNVLAKPELASLMNDVSWPDGLLDQNTPMRPFARLWLGPGGTVMPLHCDNRHILLFQIYGRKRVKLVPPFFLRSLYNTRECYGDVNADAVDYERFPAMRGVPLLRRPRAASCSAGLLRR